MRCVTCQAETVAHEHEGVHADAFPAGHGLWMSPEGLLAAARTHSASLGQSNSYEEVGALDDAKLYDVETGDAVRDCPLCRKPLNSVRYGFTSDIVVDVCRVHGVWLDDGELAAIEAWFEQHNAPDSAAAAAFGARADSRAQDELDPLRNTIQERVGVLQFLSSLTRRDRGL